MLEGMTHEQAVMLLEKFQMQGYAVFPSAPGANAYVPPAPTSNGVNGYSSGVNSGGSYGNASTNANGGSYSVGAPSGSGNNVNGVEAYRNGFHSSSPSNSNISEAYSIGGGEVHFTDESLKVRCREEAQPFGYLQRGVYEVPPASSASVGSGDGGSSRSHSVTTSSFSPFSPDPNQHQPHGDGHQGQHQHQHQQSQHQGQGQISGLYAAAEMLGKRRDLYASHGHGVYSAQLSLPHPSKVYVPGFFPVAPALQTPVGGVNGKPIRLGSGSGSGSGSPTRGGYSGGSGGGFSGSPPTQPISRPNSGSARSIGGGVASEFEAMHDLNGTLASLDLDREQDWEREFAIGERAWSLKSPTLTEARRARRARVLGGACSFG
ncbi:hypothetical protein DFH08DRAFT_984118 [Mycena albidolilacea]|uniref:Uncharacterized protein n=1 Tax=Mycena albidolilacea TaxID=1033008 RepID=A0AAD7AW61_9AGAR|nr:hypothetical protein DFH08DRAFT_984118 [Mycena albidolilacea]